MVQKKAFSVVISYGLAAILGLSGLVTATQAQGAQDSSEDMTIVVDEVPPPGGGSTDMKVIAGRVSTNRDLSQLRLLIYSFAAGTFYVQPWVAAPWTSINQKDHTFRTAIHLGSSYTLLVVDPSVYDDPPSTTSRLPKKGSPGILAITSVPAENK